MKAGISMIGIITRKCSPSGSIRHLGSYLEVYRLSGEDCHGCMIGSRREVGNRSGPALIHKEGSAIAGADNDALCIVAWKVFYQDDVGNRIRY
jgi:hypothetical protein